MPQVDLTAERWQVRQESRRNLYTGKTINSVENVAQFFKERGVNVPSAAAPSAASRSIRRRGRAVRRRPRTAVQSVLRCQKRRRLRNIRHEQVQ